MAVLLGQKFDQLAHVIDLERMLVQFCGIVVDEALSEHVIQKFDNESILLLKIYSF